MKKTIFVLCGPGGVGKSKIAKSVAEKTNLEFVKAYTTREKRPHEQDYFFVTKKEFLNLIEKKEFAEYSEFSSEYYGRKVTDFEVSLKNKPACLAIIDPISIKNIDKLDYFKDKNLVKIFIDASDEILKARLQNRKEKDKIMANKLKNAPKERKSKQFCDFVVENDNFESCVNNVCKIINDYKLK